MFKVIGLTGGIATGKTAVTQILRADKIPVIDADELAREVVSPGSFGLRAIAEVFGPEMVGQLGLDRGKLRQRIFGDEEARRTLERIVHPLIQWRAQQEFQALRKKGHKLIFYDAALIFERNLAAQFDAVVVVKTGRDTQINRLIERDKISKNEAEKILESQWPLEKKIEAADFVIDNEGSLDITKKQVRELLKTLKGN